MQSTSSTHSRRPLTIDNDTGRVINQTPRNSDGAAFAGFFDNLLSEGAAILKKGAEAYTLNAINAKLDTQQLKAQTAAELAKVRAEAEAARIKAGAQAKPATPTPTYVATGTPWYSDPKVMLPAAGALALLLFFMRRRRARR